jgi:hypothetical protein
VAGELVQREGEGGAQAGQDDHGQGGRVTAAQRLDGQDRQQQQRPGGEHGGDQQDEQAQGWAAWLSAWTTARSTMTSSAMVAPSGP